MAVILVASGGIGNRTTLLLPVALPHGLEPARFIDNEGHLFRIRAEVFGSETDVVLLTVDLFRSDIRDQALDALRLLFAHWLGFPRTIIERALLDQLVYRIVEG
jgi:hypothetical protein